jgi:hypothetical protein
LIAQPESDGGTYRMPVLLVRVRRGLCQHGSRSVPPTISPPSAPAWRNCAGSASVRTLPKATYSGTRRRSAPEACAGRLQRLAQGWDGFANPVQAAGRSGGVLPFRPPGAKRRKRLLLGPRSQKGPVDCVHQVRRPLLSSRERPSLQAPLRRHHLSLRHRGLTRSRRGRSRYPGQSSRQWSTPPRRNM